MTNVSRALIAGVDSSTQSTKLEIREQESGRIVAQGSAPHRAVTAPQCEQDPTTWWHAFEMAWAQAGSPNVKAISVAGQQHGMVALDSDGVAVHPAKLWNDTESAIDAADLVDLLGARNTGAMNTGATEPGVVATGAGRAAWADAVGSVPVAAFTITKLAWLRRTHPEAWSRLDRVMLPHDYITHRLTGKFTTDRGDASGTGYWSPSEGNYRWDILGLIDADRDWQLTVPTVLGPLDVAGTWNHGDATAVVAPGSGDNMAGALGIGLRPGDAAISIGTSGTVYSISERPTADPTGTVAGFADATGRFLPLVCTSNAAKVLDAVARLLGVDHDEFDHLALAAEPGAPILLPYFDGERTPNRPDATGLLGGLRTNVTREQFARAAIDGVACGLLDGFDALAQHADVTGRVILTGGGAKSKALRSVLAGLLNLPTVVSNAAEAVATGAAVQAAAVLEQVEPSMIQHRWGLGGGMAIEGLADHDDVRRRYAALQDNAGT